MIVGLTGQSGAGKTTVCELFKQQEDFAVIDCDKVSHDVTAKGSDCVKEIALAFDGVVNDELELDRQSLAKIVFSDREELNKLEEIIYPYITRDISALIEHYKNSGKSVIILDAPTLFEAGVDRLCDTIISVVADEDKRFERIKSRDRIPDELILKRFSSQKSIEFFTEHSEYVIYNNSDNDELMAQTDTIINIIKGKING